MSTQKRSVPSHGLFIDGKDVPASVDEMIDVHNPATGEVIARTAHGTARTSTAP